MKSIVHPAKRASVAAWAALAWLVLALVAAPTLGRLHQVVHADALERIQAGRLVAGAESPPAPSSVGGLLLQLVGSHSSADCLLLDQLALGDALHSAPPALPPAMPVQAPLPPHAGRATAPHVALFQARGPPRA